MNTQWWYRQAAADEWTRLVQVVPPTGPVVSVDEAKRHLRIYHDDDNYDIVAMVAAAQAVIEGPQGIGIALSPQTWRLSLDHFPREIIIPLGPVTSIVSVTYKDTDNSQQTVSSLRYDLDANPVKIWPARDTAFPATYYEPGVVKTTFVCGYTTLPQDLRWAILLLVGGFYDNREAFTTSLKGLAELPLGVSSILDRYRVGRFA